MKQEKPQFNATSKKQGYQSKLRARQKEMTRDLIMAAVCELISEGEILSFSVQNVADRAGISYGTVYNHFPTREVMLESLYDWGLGKYRGSESKTATNFDELMKIKRVYSTSDQQDRKLLIAINKALPALNILPKSMLKRDHDFRTIIEQEYDSLDSDFSAKASAIIVMLNNAQSWTTLMTRYGLSGEEAVVAMEWATDALFADLRERHSRK